jgi:hypothetical protein
VKPFGSFVEMFQIFSENEKEVLFSIFLLFVFKLIYLFVIMNQLASTAIFVILVDDELDEYFRR